MFNPEIYRSYDIRGLVPEELDAEEFYHIGRAYAQFVGAKRVVVARDMRVTGKELEAELVRGLVEGGTDVTRIGLATTPMFYFAVSKLRTEGGLIVTASHNPAGYNGVKMTREEAIPIAGDSGIMDIRELVEKRQWSGVGYKGKVEEADVKDEYVKMVTGGFSAKGLKVAADAGNGMTGMILRDVFDRLGGEVVPVYWKLDGSFPNHEADPLKEENLEDVKRIVHKKKADVGVAFDGDGDRVFFVTEEGKVVPGDITGALIAKEILKKHPGTAVIYDVRSSRAVPEVVEENNGRAVMWKVGHSLIKSKMRKEKAWFAGEVSGHFYFAPWFAESSILAMGYVLRVMRREGRPLSEIVKPLIRYAKTPEINFEVKNKEAVIKRLLDNYKDADRVYDFDGIRVEYKDWWFNVRPSNTEPKLRLNMEAKTERLLDGKQKEIERLIQS